MKFPKCGLLYRTAHSQDTRGRRVLIHGSKWPTDSSTVDNVVSNTVVGQYIKMLCLFLTSPPDFPLYRVERRVLNPTLTVSEAINISLLCLSLTHSLSSFFKASLSFTTHCCTHTHTTNFDLTQNRVTCYEWFYNFCGFVYISFRIRGSIC